MTKGYNFLAIIVYRSALSDRNDKERLMTRERSGERLKRPRRDDLWATGNGTDTDSKGQTKLEGSGGRLLPAVEGHSLEQK